MKRILIIVLLLLVGLVVADHVVTQKILAQTPATSKPGGLCYAQCGAYKFYWKGDFCFDMIATNCTASFNLKDAVSMLKSIRTAFISGELTEIVDVKPIFTAWLICKPLIQDCVAPQLAACQNACEQDPTLYAPNLTVGSNWGGSFQGLYYDAAKKTLSMRVMNTGLGYASDIPVSLTTSQTDSQDDTGMVASTTMTDTIPELLFFGSRQAAPKSVSDTVTDFLIDQSRFHNFLSQYKSDANNTYIPPGWEKTIPIDAPDGTLTRFTLKVDPSNQIIETSENDNTYVLDVDKRPKPPGFEIKDIKVTRNADSLTDYTVAVTIANTGDLDGEAHLTLYNGITPTGETVGSGTANVSAHGTALISKTITVDVSHGSPICAILQNFTAVVADDKGKTGSQTPTNFSIPFYAGAISGRVTDAAGKPVSGATVSTSIGRSTTTGDSGYYRIDHIDRLGNITVTITHPSFTGTVTKEVALTLNTTKATGGCNVTGLDQQVDVTLRDQPLVLHVRLKSTPGPLVTGKVIFTGGAGSFTYDVPGEKEITQMQPGQFRVTVMAPGYVTKEIQVVLTPPEQTVEITLEPLWGRDSDEGLSLHTPVKLWELTIGTGKIDAIAGSKDGKLLVVDTNDNKKHAGLLTFINPIDGVIIKSISVPFNVGQSHVALSVSYDGRTVGYMYSVQDTEVKTRSHSFLKLFDAKGNALGDKDMGISTAVMMHVSPDGFFIYPGKLMNSSLYTYTRQELEGKGGTDPEGYALNQTIFFLPDDTLIGDCKNSIQCIKTIGNIDGRLIGKVKGATRVMDSDKHMDTIIIRSDQSLSYFGKGNWEKILKRDPGFTSAAVTPGGEYAVVAVGDGNDTHLSLSVFGRSGQDETPQFTYKDVRLVEANDRGIYYSSVVSNKLTYYQLGKYQTEYTHPETQSAGESSFGGMQAYVNTTNTFEDVNYLLTWDRMYPFIMYKAKQKISITTSWGTLSVGEGTVFGKDGNGEPILLWGQEEVRATAPITMTVVNNKIFDSAALQSQMEKLYSGTLSETDFVRIQNLHTVYAVTVDTHGIAVSVTSGTVTVSFVGKKQDIHAGQVAQVNNSGGLTIHTNWMRYLSWVVGVAIFGGLGFVYFKIRNSSFVHLISKNLKKKLKKGGK